MNVKEALAKIKTAEHKAEQDMQQAEVQAAEMVKAAQRENEQLLAAARAKVEIDGKKFQVERAREVREEIERLEKETAAEIRMIREKAAQAGDKALDIVIAKLEK